MAALFRKLLNGATLHFIGLAISFVTVERHWDLALLNTKKE